MKPETTNISLLQLTDEQMNQTTDKTKQNQLIFHERHIELLCPAVNFTGLPVF